MWLYTTVVSNLGSELQRPNLLARFSITDIFGLISKSIGWALMIGALVLFMCIIIYGIQWMNSGGDSSSVSAARTKITNCLFGFAILSVSYALVLLVQYFLGISVFQRPELAYVGPGSGAAGVTCAAPGASCATIPCCDSGAYDCSATNRCVLRSPYVPPPPPVAACQIIGESCGIAGLDCCSGLICDLDITGTKRCQLIVPVPPFVPPTPTPTPTPTPAPSSCVLNITSPHGNEVFKITNSDYIIFGWNASSCKQYFYLTFTDQLGNTVHPAQIKPFGLEYGFYASELGINRYIFTIKECSTSSCTSFLSSDSVNFQVKI